MFRTLLASSSLSLAMLLLPAMPEGPLTATGAAGLSVAHAEFGIDLGGIQIGDDDDDDGGDDDDDGGDDDDDGEDDGGDDDEDDD